MTLSEIHEMNQLLEIVTAADERYSVLVQRLNCLTIQYYRQNPMAFVREALIRSGKHPKK